MPFPTFSSLAFTDDALLTVPRFPVSRFQSPKPVRDAANLYPGRQAVVDSSSVLN